MVKPANYYEKAAALWFKQGYLLDRFLAALQAKFVKEGGFRESLFRQRREYKLGKFD